VLRALLVEVAAEGEGCVTSRGIEGGVLGNGDGAGAAVAGGALIVL